ncbi:MAG TPA: hypothetical protein VM869_27640 [Enhygromyxa sp.]|nr:hypothetical protein [Enhygromyxa sp.]
MTIYEQAFQEGYREGREEGYREGALEFLTELLAMKFGKLPPACMARLQAASNEELFRYSERSLTADTLEAVFDPT